jgi:hypothetical protein
VVAGTYFGRLEVVHGVERDVKTKALSIVR